MKHHYNFEIQRVLHVSKTSINVSTHVDTEKCSFGTTRNQSPFFEKYSKAILNFRYSSLSFVMKGLIMSLNKFLLVPVSFFQLHSLHDSTPLPLLPHNRVETHFSQNDAHLVVKFEKIDFSLEHWDGSISLLRVSLCTAVNTKGAHKCIHTNSGR